MACKAGHMQLAYHDNHPSVAPNYFWHSSVPNNRRNKDYTLCGNCTFRVKVGGRPGTANLGFRFNYSLFDGISPSSAPQSESTAEDTAFSSGLDIAYDS